MAISIQAKDIESRFPPTVASTLGRRPSRPRSPQKPARHLVVPEGEARSSSAAWITTGARPASASPRPSAAPPGSAAAAAVAAAVVRRAARRRPREPFGFVQSPTLDEGNPFYEDPLLPAHEGLQIAAPRRRGAAEAPARRPRRRGAPARPGARPASAHPALHDDARDDSPPAAAPTGAAAPTRNARRKRRRRRAAAAARALVPQREGDASFAEFLMHQLRDAEDRQDEANNAELRSRLQLFAQTERVHADKVRLLRKLQVMRRRQYGEGNGAGPKGSDGDRSWDNSGEAASAEATSRVVAKVRRFYAELRAERSILNNVNEEMKKNMVELQLRTERAEAQAAASLAARAHAERECEKTQVRMEKAITHASTTMSAAAAASASSSSDAVNLRVEVEGLRRELADARRAGDELRQERDAAVRDATEKGRADHQRCLDLAEFGARLQTRVQGAEDRAEGYRARADSAEERAHELEMVHASNAALKVEVEKFKKSAQQAGRAFGSRKSVSKRKSVAKKQGSEGKMTMRAPRAPKRSMVANGANSPRMTKRGKSPSPPSARRRRKSMAKRATQAVVRKSRVIELAPRKSALGQNKAQAVAIPTAGIVDDSDADDPPPPRLEDESDFAPSAAGEEEEE
ncbi:hypothetical protein JL720_6369 [Aureococcus anophagefferens]|nr:hypothetical protein JL720_6369 [Aureococcus anophagefferens]